MTTTPPASRSPVSLKSLALAKLPTESSAQVLVNAMVAHQAQSARLDRYVSNFAPAASTGSWRRR